MITIYISKSFIKNTINLRLKDFKESLNENDIKEKIKKCLIQDELINTNDSINWINDDYKFQGIYIRENNIVVYFCQMLNKQNKTRSRNTYVSQNFMPILDYAKKRLSKITISINPFDYNKNIYLPESIILHINQLIINYNVILTSSIQAIVPNVYIFNNLNRYLSYTQEISNKNIHNKPKFIKVFNHLNKLIVFGKTKGANWSDTYNTCVTISILNKTYKLFYISIDNENIENNKIKLLENINFKILEENDEVASLKKILQSKKVNKSKENILKRNQFLFIRNIIKKYSKIKNFNVEKCFVCDYFITKNLIAGHIYRCSDIINDYYDKKITLDTAINLMVSGDNGLFLCPNHDKEFENGLIYFDLLNSKFISNSEKLNMNESLYISSKLNDYTFQNIELTQPFVENINKHLKRINKK